MSDRLVCLTCGKELLLTLSGMPDRCYRCATGREPTIQRAGRDVIRETDPIREWATWRRRTAHAPASVATALLAESTLPSLRRSE